MKFETKKVKNTKISIEQKPKIKKKGIRKQTLTCEITLSRKNYKTKSQKCWNNEMQKVLNYKIPKPKTGTFEMLEEKKSKI